MNYFGAGHEILEEDWESRYQSVLLKTTGYNALMKLFADVYAVLYAEKNFTLDRFLEALEPLHRLSGRITAERYGASGASSTNKLYRDFNKLIME